MKIIWLLLVTGWCVLATHGAAIKTKNSGAMKASSALDKAQSSVAKAHASLDEAQKAALLAKQSKGDQLSKKENLNVAESYVTKSYLDKDTQDDLHQASNTDLKYSHNDVLDKSSKSSYHTGNYNAADTKIQSNNALDAASHDDQYLNKEDAAKKSSDSAVEAAKKDDLSASNSKQETHDSMLQADGVKGDTSLPGRPHAGDVHGDKPNNPVHHYVAPPDHSAGPDAGNSNRDNGDLPDVPDVVTDNKPKDSVPNYTNAPQKPSVSKPQEFYSNNPFDSPFFRSSNMYGADPFNSDFFKKY